MGAYSARSHKRSGSTMRVMRVRYAPNARRVRAPVRAWGSASNRQQHARHPLAHAELDRADLPLAGAVFERLLAWVLLGDCQPPQRQDARQSTSGARSTTPSDAARFRLDRLSSAQVPLRRAATASGGALRQRARGAPSSSATSPVTYTPSRKRAASDNSTNVEASLPRPRANPRRCG